MSIEVPPKRPASAFGGQRTAPVPQLVQNKTKIEIDPEKAHRRGLRHRQLLRASDSVTLAASAVVGAVLIRHISTARAGDLGIRDVIVVAVALAVALQLHGLYRRPDGRLRPSEWWRPAVIARCLPTAALLALAADAFILRGERAMTLTAAVAMTLPAIVLVPFGRRLVVRMFDPTVSRILVIGTGPVSDRLTSRLQRCPDTLVIGHVDNNAAPGVAVLGGLDDLPDICARYAIDRVIVGFPNTSDSIVLDALRRLQGQVPVSEIPRYFELHNWRSEAEELHGLTLMHLPTPSLAPSARITKRLMDVALAACALLVTAPALLVIAVAIKLDTRGPVFFRQERTGRGGKPFRIFKFRSMTADAWEQRMRVAQLNQSDGPLFKMESDPRVTRVGAFIRKTSLDELPQLINVVRGEMSLVGPRPLPTEEADRIDGAALARLDVSPGITGLWQVCGRSDLSYADLQHLDSAYVRSWSLSWDLRILLQTPQVVFGRNGAY
ncbi:sugar transferase [Mycolicibacterium sphagni]|uniref:Sugar transferase n=1 Tax=Mycolicibacterium sphagni TaxID=1786 RepID=A0ABX2JZA5_9MYCO|nr:sugar transferase [Mycolicibacterium sphagni]NTY62232.1 sugar transferase [Mycolicibacterium sphagni]